MGIYVRKVLAVTVLSLLTYGCGVMKNKNRAPLVDTEIPAPKSDSNSKRILYPVGYEESGDVYLESISDEERDRMVHKQVANAFDITFPPAESAHIRVAGINPLPEGGKLELSIDDMARDFRYPYEGKLISDYGMRGRGIHTGVDLKTVPNDTIRAAFPGVVRMSKNYSGYGNIVVIRHYYGFETVYAHCSKNLVEVNDVVYAGTPVGLAGRTGRATTEHLHFEMRAAGEPINPNRLIDVEGMRLQPGKLTIEKHGNKIVAYGSGEELKRIEEKEEQSAGPVQPQAAAVKPKTPAGTAGTNTASVSQSAQDNSAAAQYHKVQKGDTLWGISRKYNTSVKKICELNNIGETSTLRIDQRLRVK